MLKKIISFAFLFSLLFAASSKANWGWQSQGYYNPAFFNQGLGLMSNPYWGGGYNLNSMMGNGGWGGFPAGYGTMMMPPSMPPSMPSAGLCPSGGGGGAMTGGFGGYYSPFIGGY